MNNHYDMKEQMKEILQTNGGKVFFDELNAAGIPFFFITTTENTGEKTDYICETITPGAMGIRLTDDKFADHLNIQYQGFVTVLESPIHSRSEGAGFWRGNGNQDQQRPPRWERIHCRRKR